MKRKSLGAMPCPIARSIERVGEWWSILILRDALHGFRRFDDFQQSLGIAPNMLTRRLQALVEAGLLERRRYCEHPPRYEYLPTERARDFRPVLMTLQAWGNKHFAPEGASVMLIDTETGAPVDLMLADRNTGRSITETDHVLVPGPAAGARTRERYARRDQLAASAAQAGAGGASVAASGRPAEAPQRSSKHARSGAQR
jgi:DNA-binding HxlR family transcriptional regulator